MLKNSKTQYFIPLKSLRRKKIKDFIRIDAFILDEIFVH